MWWEGKGGRGVAIPRACASARSTTQVPLSVITFYPHHVPTHVPLSLSHTHTTTDPPHTHTPTPQHYAPRGCTALPPSSHPHPHTRPRLPFTTHHTHYNRRPTHYTLATHVCLHLALKRNAGALRVGAGPRRGTRPLAPPGTAQRPALARVVRPGCLQGQLRRPRRAGVRPRLVAHVASIPTTRPVRAQLAQERRLLLVLARLLHWFWRRGLSYSASSITRTRGRLSSRKIALNPGGREWCKPTDSERCASLRLRAAQCDRQALSAGSAGSASSNARVEMSYRLNYFLKTHLLVSTFALLRIQTSNRHTQYTMNVNSIATPLSPSARSRNATSPKSPTQV